MADEPKRPITRADINAKLHEIQGEVEDTAERAKPIGLAVGIGVAVALVALAYLLGRRKGRKRTTIVEVRRV
jgi:hypothetical protein